MRDAELVIVEVIEAHVYGVLPALGKWCAIHLTVAVLLLRIEMWIRLAFEAVWDTWDVGLAC